MVEATPNELDVAAVPAPASVAPSLAELGVAPHALKGWAALRQAMNVELPQLLNRAEETNKATLRVLGG